MERQHFRWTTFRGAGSTKLKSTAFAKRESVVHFEAFVKYKDVFDGERETCFKKIWVVYEMGDKRSSI
jgi:hypothetical protein